MGLVSALIDRFQSRYPGVTDAEGLVLYKDVWKEIANRCQYRNTTVAIQPTAGTREYEWAETDVKAWLCMYFADSSDPGRIIEPVSTDELNLYDPTWRGDTNRDIPDFYYFHQINDGTGAKTMIGFHRIPVTSYSGGYPVINVYCTSYADQAAGDTVPPNLMSEQVILDGMCFLWAKERHHDAIGMWKELFENELHKNINHLKGMQGVVNTRIHRTWMQGRAIY